MSSNRAYLDHNSTSPLRPEVASLWQELLAQELGNPSSLHRSGRAARHVIDTARERIASALGVGEEEITFTSGGTESNNLAVWGGLEALGTNAELITTRAEHSSVLEVAEQVERRGTAVGWIEVDRAGALRPTSLQASLAGSAGPLLVSVHLANNETGTIQPIREVQSALDEAGRRALLHIDAVQALGRIPLDLVELGVDLASFSAHKVGGPIGVGLLYRRKGTALAPRSYGGGQELGLRPGTENAAMIGAAGLAVELAVREQQAFAARVSALAEELWSELAVHLPGARLLGHEWGSARRLPNTVTVLVPGTDGKVLVTALDLAGCEASAGSACASGSLEPSHVLLAMGWSVDEARAGLRLSLGWNTTRDDCQHAVDVLRKVAAASHAT